MAGSLGRVRFFKTEYAKAMGRLIRSPDELDPKQPCFYFARNDNGALGAVVSVCFEFYSLQMIRSKQLNNNKLQISKFSSNIRLLTNSRKPGALNCPLFMCCKCYVLVDSSRSVFLPNQVRRKINTNLKQKLILSNKISSSYKKVVRVYR